MSEQPSPAEMFASMTEALVVVQEMVTRVEEAARGARNHLITMGWSEGTADEVGRAMMVGLIGASFSASQSPQE